MQQVPLTEHSEKFEGLNFKRGLRKGLRLRICFWVIHSTLAATFFAARSQPASPPPQSDPLMNLMLSQAKVELGLVTVMSSFDPPIVRPGQETFYRVTVTALEQSVELPSLIPTQPIFKLKPGAHGQILQVVEGKQIPLTTFNFRARPSNLGEFIVPSFGVKVYGKPMTVPSARLQVVEKPTDPELPRQVLLLDFPTTNLFVGQSVRARIRSPGSSTSVQILSQAQLIGEGFVVDQSSIRQSIQPTPYGGSNIASFIYETTLTPIASGKIAVAAQAYTGGSRLTPQFTLAGTAPSAGGPPQYTLLEADPVQLMVDPLPRSGELPGFTGGIGSFSLDPPKLSTNSIVVGDAVQLTVAIHSSSEGNNLSRLSPPPPPKSDQWQILSANPDPTPPTVIQAQGFTLFRYILVPLTEQAKSTPPIPFSFFDPSTRKYSDLTIPPVALTVRPGAVAADLQTLLQTNATPVDGDEELTLRDLAATPGHSSKSLVPWQEQSWFPLLQLCPAAAFLGLWGWDQRRRYHEANPHILRRRRARRALRREWRNARGAARARDELGFVTAAVNAMRVACAPHYPAEPQALVGADVIELLGNGSSAPREIELVRRFFNLSDRSRFGSAPAESPGLLNLQAELDQILQRLEAKLS